jgi:DNA (cytosine-5)-methyltransferase 1
VVFENVPGLLSSDKGRDFGTFLGLLGECGYGFAYRVLDAQYWRIPQRRRRVFVVGCLGDWRPAAAVLFEPESLRGDSPPSREAGERIAGSLEACANGGGARFGTDFMCNGGLIPLAREASTTTVIAHSLRAEGFDASEDGTGRGTPIIPIQGTVVAIHENQRAEMTFNNTAGSLKVGGGKPGQGYPAIAFTERTRADGRNFEAQEDLAYALCNPGSGGRTHSRQLLDASMAVRRLTPRECERLQGFPDDFTLVPYRGKPAADGPRYRALGNSMAVPVMRWIGERVNRSG